MAIQVQKPQKWPFLWPLPESRSCWTPPVDPLKGLKLTSWPSPWQGCRRGHSHLNDFLVTSAVRPHTKLKIPSVGSVYFLPTLPNTTYDHKLHSNLRRLPRSCCVFIFPLLLSVDGFTLRAPSYWHVLSYPVYNWYLQSNNLCSWSWYGLPIHYAATDFIPR
jgi:hypothetical protein